MSIIIATGDAISKSPLNQSTSKQMYSFPKAGRFNRINNSRYLNYFYKIKFFKYFLL